MLCPRGTTWEHHHHGELPLHIDYITASINNRLSDTQYKEHTLHTTIGRSNQHHLAYEARSRHPGTPQRNYSYHLEQYINT
jgi:hypothetical protein